MSITTTSTKDSYTGNNSTSTPYPITFKYLEDSHITVYVDGVELSDSYYTLTGDGSLGTGQFTTALAYTGTQKVVVVLDVPFNQPVELLETGVLSANTLEEAYDRLNMQIRRVWRKAQDVLTFSSDEGGAGSTGTADTLVGFDSSGDLGEIPNSKFCETANNLSDVDAATARTNLDVDQAGTRFALSELTDTTITNPVSGETLEWNGSAWVNQVSGSTSGSNVTASDTVPVSPEAGDLWFDSTTTQMFVYYNDGSSSQWVTVTSGSPSTDSDTVTYTPAGTGALATSVETKLRESVSVKDFGAVGDGVADDTTAIQNALNSGAESVQIPDGTYLLTSTLSISSSVSINADNGAFLDFSSVADAVSLSEISLVDVNGSIESSVALTADHLTGSSTITVADTSSFTAGDLILLKSNAYYSTGVSTGSNKQGWLTYVTSVDNSTTLSVANGAYADLTTAQSASISKVNPITFNWNGGSILGGGIGSGHDGFTLDYTSNSSVRNVKVDGCEGVGIGCYYSINVLVDHCDVFNCTSSATLGNSGYGFLAGSGSFGVTASNNEFRNCRHSVSGGGVVTVRGVIILNNRSFAGGLSTNDFDCHEPCFDWVFDGNTITQGGSSLGGMVVRGKNIKVINNTFNGGNGALFQTFIADTNGQTGLIAGGNSFVNCNFGIKLDTTSSAISQVRITDNYLENSDFGAVVLDDATDVVVSSNTINGTRDGSGTSGQGVDTRGGSNIVIDGNVMKSIISDAVYSVGTSNMVISNNSVETAEHGLNVDNGSNISITGNHIKSNSSLTSSRHGMVIDDVSDLSVTGNSVVAHTNTSNCHGIQIAQSAGTALDHVVSGNVVVDYDKGIRSVSSADYTIITSNNVRSCTNATKIESTGANSISANNLI